MSLIQEGSREETAARELGIDGLRELSGIKEQLNSALWNVAVSVMENGGNPQVLLQRLHEAANYVTTNVLTPELPVMISAHPTSSYPQTRDRS